MKGINNLGAVLLLCINTACSHADEALAVGSPSIIYRSASCGDADPHLDIIDNSEALKNSIQEPKVRWQPESAVTPSSSDALQWSDDAVFFKLSMGQQSQGGYQFTLRTDHFEFANGAMQLYAEASPPAEGKMHIQKVDRPCIIAKILAPKQSVEKIQVKLSTPSSTIDLIATRDKQ